jgi:hypothetical protein
MAGSPLVFSILLFRCADSQYETRDLPRLGFLDLLRHLSLV